MESHIQEPAVTWIDSHAHLGDVDDLRLDTLVAAARENQVGRILNVATSLSSSISVLRQCGRHSCLSASLGISPFDVLPAPHDWLSRLETLAQSPLVAAIGETGIDATNPRYPPRALQRDFFEKHLGLAASLGLPAVVHSRGCEREALDICVSSGVRRAVFHCYTGPRETLARIIDAGYAVSFSGIITFKNTPLSPLVLDTPILQLLIETDSPYLAPVPHRGLQNQPAWVALVGKAVAAIKKIDEEECRTGIAATYSRVFTRHAASPPAHS
jgi:TatD DNase family protein